MTNNRTAVHTTDLSGCGIVSVPLAKGAGFAVLDAADFEALCVLGFTPNWYFNGTPTGRYVRAGMATKGHGVGLARVVMGAGARQIVKYRDGDTTNLRRANLWITKGAAKRTDARIVADAPLQGPGSAPVALGVHNRTLSGRLS